jgi:hypothetical protein
VADDYVNRTGTKRRGGKYRHCFSQTFLNQYTTCPESARATYFREVPSQVTDASARGTAVHEGIEYLLHEKMNGDLSWFSVDDAIQVAHAKLDRIGEWKYTKYSRQKVYDDQATLIAAFYGEILDEVDPLRIEQRFDVPLYEDDKREIRLLGTMDCVDQNVEGWDWKTTREPYVPWEKQRWAIQPTVYAYSIDQVENEKSEVGVFSGSALFHYGVLFPDGSTQILSVERDQGAIDFLIQQCLQIAMMIERKVKPWPMNDNHVLCSPKWCDNWMNCKGAVVLDGWDKSPK